jgi:hypothetical protein
MNLIPVLNKILAHAHTELELDVLGVHGKNVSVLSDISLLSDGLGQYRQVLPNLSQCSDAIWQLLFQKKTLHGKLMIYVVHLSKKKIEEKIIFFT